MQVNEKLMGGLFALQDKFISGCKILASKKNWVIIILRFVAIFKTMSVRLEIVFALQL
jgi:hypothetical protein